MWGILEVTEEGGGRREKRGQKDFEGREPPSRELVREPCPHKDKAAPSQTLVAQGTRLVTHREGAGISWSCLHSASSLCQPGDFSKSRFCLSPISSPTSEGPWVLPPRPCWASQQCCGDCGRTPGPGKHPLPTAQPLLQFLAMGRHTFSNMDIDPCVVLSCSGGEGGLRAGSVGTFTQS